MYNWVICLTVSSSPLSFEVHPLIRLRKHQRKAVDKEGRLWHGLREHRGLQMLFNVLMFFYTNVATINVDSFSPSLHLVQFGLLVVILCFLSILMHVFLWRVKNLKKTLKSTLKSLVKMC